MIDKTQKFDIRLEQIVPENHSPHEIIKNFFFKRHSIALSLLNEIRPNKVLDAGCGDGIFTNKITKIPHCRQIVGIDFNAHVHHLNQKNHPIHFLRANIHSLPFKKVFDAVTCLDVLEHFEDVNSILLKLKKVIKKDGHLIISGPTESFWYKCGRFLAKGSFSQETGPGAGKHYYNVAELHKMIGNHFKLIKKTKLRFFAFHSFDIILYQMI